VTDQDTNSRECLHLTAEIVAAYVANNAVAGADLAGFIATVHGVLLGLGTEPAPVADKRVPPVSIRKSVTPDFLVSLEDGRQYKSLKRHLAGRGLTPSEYRIKWGLDFDYPMVAPNYAKHRSDLAKASGLGRKRVAPAKPVRARRPASA
jgi:predicted transcriptional regulator